MITITLTDDQFDNIIQALEDRSIYLADAPLSDWGGDEQELQEIRESTEATYAALTGPPVPDVRETIEALRGWY